MKDLSEHEGRIVVDVLNGRKGEVVLALVGSWKIAVRYLESGFTHVLPPSRYKLCEDDCEPCQAKFKCWTS